MERLTPEMLAFIIFLAVLSIGVQTAWQWRASLVRGVKRFAPPASAPRVAYVAQPPRTAPEMPTDPGLSAGLSGLSVWSAPLPAPVQTLMVDRTRAALLSALVAAGWKTGDIRAVLKGDNGRIGEEVETEQQRQNITPPARPPLQVAAGRPEAYALDRDSGDRVDELRAEPAP